MNRRITTADDPLPCNYFILWSSFTAAITICFWNNLIASDSGYAIEVDLKINPRGKYGNHPISAPYHTKIIDLNPLMFIGIFVGIMF
jgi:hypothetical protein